MGIRGGGKEGRGNPQKVRPAEKTHCYGQKVMKTILVINWLGHSLPATDPGGKIVGEKRTRLHGLRGKRNDIHVHESGQIQTFPDLPGSAPDKLSQPLYLLHAYNHSIGLTTSSSCWSFPFFPANQILLLKLVDKQ